jgi:uncharacterized protein (TIGR03067 family)
MFKKMLALAVAVTVILGTCSTGDGGQEAKKFEGTWVLVKMEVQGKSLLKKDEKASKFIIKDGKLMSDAVAAPKEPLELSRVVDAAKQPSTVTLPLEGKIKFYGIYEVNGDELRVCGEGVDTAQDKNPEARRPKEFDSNKGLLLVFKRERK